MECDKLNQRNKTCYFFGGRRRHSGGREILWYGVLSVRQNKNQQANSGVEGLFKLVLVIQQVVQVNKRNIKPRARILC